MFFSSPKPYTPPHRDAQDGLSALWVEERLARRRLEEAWLATAEAQVWPPQFLAVRLEPNRQDLAMGGTPWL